MDATEFEQAISLNDFREAAGIYNTNRVCVKGLLHSWIQRGKTLYISWALHHFHMGINEIVNDKSPIQLAIELQDVKLMKILLDKGANPNLCTIERSICFTRKVDYLSAMDRTLAEFVNNSNEKTFAMIILMLTRGGRPFAYDGFLADEMKSFHKKVVKPLIDRGYRVVCTDPKTQYAKNIQKYSENHSVICARTTASPDYHYFLDEWDTENELRGLPRLCAW